MLSYQIFWTKFQYNQLRSILLLFLCYDEKTTSLYCNSFMQIEINISSFFKLTLSSDLNMLTHDNVECLVSKSYKNVILCIFLLPYDKWSCHMQKSFLYFYLILKWRRSVSYFYAYWKKIGKENSVSTSILLIYWDDWLFMWNKKRNRLS